MRPALHDAPQRWERSGLVITTDRSAMDLDQAFALLRTSWWAGDMSRELFDRAMYGSVVFTAEADGAVVGLARVVTDLATYGYLTDVRVSASPHEHM